MRVKEFRRLFLLIQAVPSTPVTFFVLLFLGIFSWSRDWGEKGFKTSKTSLAVKIWSFCFATHRSAQCPTARPHGHVPNITASLYYQYSKEFIAPPHFHCYLCPPRFQHGLVEKNKSAQNIPGPEKIQESLNSDNPYSMVLHLMSWQLPEILDDPLSKTTRVNVLRLIHQYNSLHKEVEERAE